MQFRNIVNGTQDLENRIDEFENSVYELGPLGMPDVEEKIEEIKTKDWQLRTILDRLSGPNPLPIDPKYNTAEENSDALLEWFASEEKCLDELFKPYLNPT